MRLNFYLLDLVDASCLNIPETVAVKMRRDKFRQTLSNFAIYHNEYYANKPCRLNV
jgi:hypothetical protein